MNKQIELDTWVSCSDLDKFTLCGVTHLMHSCFDEYYEDNVGTASLKFKFKDGTESVWYHPPSEAVSFDISTQIFKQFRTLLEG